MSGVSSGRASTLPAWMTEPEPRAEVKKHTKTRFLSKSLNEIKKTIANNLLTEHLAARPGLLQKVDPRVKLLGLIILIIVSGVTRSIAALIALAFLSVVLMRLSKLPVWTLQKRIWSIIPVISLLAAAPGMLSIFNPGLPLFFLWTDPAGIRIGSLHLAGPVYVSRQGVTAALFLFMRTGLSLSLGTLLVLTTPMARLLHSIRILRVPALLVMVVEMSYRYLMLLLTVSLEMFEAREMRTVGILPGAMQRTIAGSSFAALFNRSIVLSEEVYQAMTCRGYTGEAVDSQKLALKHLDFASAIFVLCAAVITIWGGSIFEWWHIFLK
ncbi:MAG: cobalt ECF transporter T component CbiQ [Syntrophomonas sp.]